MASFVCTCLESPYDLANAELGMCDESGLENAQCVLFSETATALDLVSLGVTADNLGYMICWGMGIVLAFWILGYGLSIAKDALFKW